MAEAGVVVWYNPRCSKCRGAEQLLAAYGVPAQRVFYLDNPPARAEITACWHSWGQPTRVR
jgi:arsenate reductase (glutaredoxin)